MKLIIEPADGVAPLPAAIKSAKTSIEIAVFRFDRKDIEAALKAAAERGVKVTALIAFANRGGERGLRKLELRCLAAGIIIARTSDDLSRGFGIVTPRGCVKPHDCSGPTAPGRSTRRRQTRLSSALRIQGRCSTRS